LNVQKQSHKFEPHTEKRSGSQYGHLDMIDLHGHLAIHDQKKTATDVSLPNERNNNKKIREIALDGLNDDFVLLECAAFQATRES